MGQRLWWVPTLSAFAYVSAYHYSPIGRAPRTIRTAVAMNLLDAAADGDISATLEIAAFATSAAFATGAAWSLVKEDERDRADTPGLSDDAAAVGDDSAKVAVDVDLGANGEPKGMQRLYFKPLLPRSEFLLLELRVPLGLLIKESVDGESILVEGALPDYSAFNQVEAGDLIRAVTGYAMVAGDAPMWQQITSGTPLGDVGLKRVIFRTEGAKYDDIRSAIASHRTSEGGNGRVCLVIERAVDDADGRPPRREADKARPRQEPLFDVIARDLRTPSAGEG